jgi:hypothetical protein
MKAIIFPLLILVMLTLPVDARIGTERERWVSEQTVDTPIILCKPMPHVGGNRNQQPGENMRGTQQVCARPNVRFYALTPDGETLKHIMLPINVQ